MSYLLICLTVDSFDRWIRCFDDEGTMRWAFGSRSSATYRRTGDPCRIAVLFTWDDAERARLFTQSEEFRDFLTRAGALEQRVEWLLDEPKLDQS